MMNEYVSWTLALLLGLALGAFFFGGLWWTVRRGLHAQRPALWFLLSLLVRTAVVLAGFYWIAGPQWQRLLACMAGFVLARLILVRFVRLDFTSEPLQKTES